MRRSVLESRPRCFGATAPPLSSSLALTLLLVGGTARAAEFYVDPATGAATGDGSMAKPWQTLEAVVQAGQFGKAIHAGDTVWLLTGYHGAFAAPAGTYAPPITVAAATGQIPRLSRVSFAQTHGWVVSGLSISPSHAPSPQASFVPRSSRSSRRTVSNRRPLGSTEWR